MEKETPEEAGAPDSGSDTPPSESPRAKGPAKPPAASSPMNQATSGQPDTSGADVDADDDSIEAAVAAIENHPVFDPEIVGAAASQSSREGSAQPRSFRSFMRGVRRFFLSRGFSKALGIVGESLITAGVVVMLFLGWQLWINDVIVFNESSAVAQKNAAEWSAVTASPTIKPTSSPGAPVDYGPAPVISGVGENEVFGNIYIPRLGQDYVKVLANGVSPDGTLNKGYFGHYPDSQWPGESGNFAVAVHRAGHGSPFKAAPQLRAGDLIVVQTSQGYYSYRVRNTEYVNPTQVEVVNAVPGGSSSPVQGQSIFTITTCNPELGNNERLITYSVFVGWQPKDAGPPAEIASMVTQ